MSVPNFSSLAGLEVAEKFVGGGGGGGVHVTTMSNSNASCFRVELSCVGFWQYETLNWISEPLKLCEIVTKTERFFCYFCNICLGKHNFLSSILSVTICDWNKLEKYLWLNYISLLYQIITQFRGVKNWKIYQDFEAPIEMPLKFY